MRFFYCRTYWFLPVEVGEVLVLQVELFKPVEVGEVLVL